MDTNRILSSLVAGDLTLSDLLIGKDLSDEQEHEVARFYAMGHHTMVGSIKKLQSKLWDLEMALNVPFGDRVRLEKGWIEKSHLELACLGAIVTSKLGPRREELRVMTEKHGHADGLRAIVESMMPDVRKDVQAYVTDGGRLDPEDLFPGFPRGFRYMNAREVDDLISALRELRQKYKDKLVERRADAERAAARRAEELALYAAIDAKRKERKAQIAGEIASYKDAVAKLSEHPVFRAASLKATNLYPVLDSDYQLVRMSDAEFDTLLAQSRSKVVAATRSLREPLRRAWQSAQSRGVTWLGFQEYLVQEGFGSLFTA